MENRFLICCHDCVLVGTRSECDRYSCEHGKHSPEFDVYYHKANNEYFYFLNRQQLGQYWQCVIADRDAFCPVKCEKCSICKEMANVFVELQDSLFFYPKRSVGNNFDQVPYQPISWRVFNSVIDKKNKKFHIEFGKSIPHTELVLNYGKTR